MFYFNKDKSRYEDLLFYEISKRIYYFGNHFTKPQEKNSRDYYLLKLLAKSLCFIIANLFYQKGANQNIILCNAYFNLDNEIKKIGYNVKKPCWSFPSSDVLLKNYTNLIDLILFKYKLRESCLVDILNNDFFELIDNISIKLDKYFRQSSVKGLIISSDLPFFENLSLKLLRKINKPSIIFLHGLPGVYNILNDNLSDYLFVWGEEIKKNFLNSGFKKEKIFVVGHPLYKNYILKKIKFDMSNVLVISDCNSGAQLRDKIRYQERGYSIRYIYSIEEILKKRGIKRAMLRLHPNENPFWYKKFMDNSFYSIDKLPLFDSIRKSSIVIGPASTVFLESLINGVNYLVYSPNVDVMSTPDFPLVPPFDGSDKRIPIATNEENLISILKNKEIVDNTILNDYIEPNFDISILKKIIK